MIPVQMAIDNLARENIWCDKSSYDKAECSYFERRMKSVRGSRMPASSDGPASGSLANEVAKARQHIKQGLQCVTTIADNTIVSHDDLSSRMARLEMDNRDLRTIVDYLSKSLAELNKIVGKLSNTAIATPFEAAVVPHPSDSSVLSHATKSDDEIDLFGSDSDDEDAEVTRIREERLAAYAVKKSKKPVLIAKSNIIFDVKPWDDETDMGSMEEEVRKIGCEGLLWGAAKLVPLAYGIHKLQISCVLEDDKVSVDWLTEKIEEITNFVQSVDIAAFNKV